MVMGETRYEANRRMLPILRTSSGRFMGLGESPMMDFDRMTGRFAQFLPENYPSMEVQQKAKELFQMVVEERGKERSAERGRDRGFARGED